MKSSATNRLGRRVCVGSVYGTANRGWLKIVGTLRGWRTGNAWGMALSEHPAPARTQFQEKTTCTVPRTYLLFALFLKE